MSAREHDGDVELVQPWVAANPGFVKPELPWRVCDWSRDYGYFATVEEARAAAAELPPVPTVDLLGRVDHWTEEAGRALESGQRHLAAGDHELAAALADLSAACSNIAARYLERAKA